MWDGCCLDSPMCRIRGVLGFALCPTGREHKYSRRSETSLSHEYPPMLIFQPKCIFEHCRRKILRQESSCKSLHTKRPPLPPPPRKWLKFCKDVENRDATAELTVGEADFVPSLCVDRQLLNVAA